jgi:glycosyltransferase involved in cell wall biosynthesis
MVHMPTKPEILHLVTDDNVGGLKTSLDVFLNSRLASKFSLSVALTKDFKTISREYKPNVIVFHTACSWVNLIKLFPLDKYSKLIICEHHYNSIFSKFVPSQPRFYLLLRIFYGLANRVVAISRNQVEWMQQNHLVDPRKIVMISPARVLDDFLALSPISQAPDSCLHLGAYGRFSKEKGFDILIEAMHLLRDLPIKLYIGGEGPEEDSLKAMANGLNNIEFVGIVDNVPEFLKNCDAVVIPSRRETWGFVCTEAKAAARPVVASAIGGLVEQLSDLGILVSPESPEVIAAEVRNLYALPKSALRELGERNRKSIAGDLERYLTQWDDLICELLA